MNNKPDFKSIAHSLGLELGPGLTIEPKKNKRPRIKTGVLVAKSDSVIDLSKCFSIVKVRYTPSYQVVSKKRVIVEELNH
jgi:hypothetical protein